MVRLAGRVELADGVPAAARNVHAEAPGMCLLDGALTAAWRPLRALDACRPGAPGAVVRHGSDEHRASGIDPVGDWRAPGASDGELLRGYFRRAGADGYDGRRSHAEGWHRLEARVSRPG